MERRKMKRMILGFVLVLSLVAAALPGFVTSKAQATPSRETLLAAYRAYYDLLKSEIDKYGIGAMWNWEYSVYGGGGYSGGAYYAELVDFDNDGLPELLYVRHDEDDSRDLQYLTCDELKFYIFGYSEGIFQHFSEKTGYYIYNDSLDYISIATGNDGKLFLVVTQEYGLSTYYNIVNGAWNKALEHELTITYDGHMASVGLLTIYSEYINDVLIKERIYDYYDNFIREDVYYDITPESELGIVNVRTLSGIGVDGPGDVLPALAELESRIILLESAPTPTPETSTAPDVPEYIYTPPAFASGFTVTPGAVKDITDEASAKSAIFDVIASLTPEQRQSGDALDDTALFIENAVRAGSSRNVSGGVSLGAAILSALADIARDISASVHSTLERENIGLLRILRTNVTIRSDETGNLQIIFPDDVSGVEFDNVTVEADFASVTFSRDDIRSGGEVTLRKLLSENSEPVSDEPAVVSPEYDENAFNPLDFWSVGVIVLILVVWCVLALCKHRLRAWVVPTFCILALALNAYTYFRGSVGDIGDTENDENTTPALSEDYTSEALGSIEITLSEGVKATVSLPTEGDNKDFLTLFNENDEIQYSKYNPITDMVDARIRESGVYTLKEYTVSFTDIDKKSDLMKDAILQLASKNIMTGTTDGFFFPDKPITRAELVSAIVRAFDLLDMDTVSSFTDIDRSDWFYSAAATAEKERIISGFEDNTFRGDLDIPKDQLVTVSANTLIEFMGYKIPADIEAELARYLDREDIASWSEGSIALATQSNIMIYRTDSLFAPRSIMTRGDAAIVLYRVFSKVW